MQTILGWDCSSSTIGYGVLQWDELTNEIHLVKMDYFKPIKTGPIIDRIADTRDKVMQIIEEACPQFIAIEEIIQFMAGKSTAKTIIALTTFNRMIGLTCYDYLGHSPKMCNVMSIRHGLKLTSALPSKEDIPDLVAHHLGISFPYEYGKRGKLLVENGDKADGCAVALYQAFVLSGKIVLKIKKPKSKKHKSKKVKLK